MPQIRALPHNDTRNGWQLTAAGRQPKPPLEGRHKASLLVVGAGFAGLAAAHRYAALRPNDSIVLVDAKTVGDGASGRNSGFILGIRHQAEAAGVSPIAVAERIRRISQSATRFLDDIVTRHQIRCDWQRDGMYIGAVGPKGEACLQRLSQELVMLDEPHELLGSAETRKALGTGHYRAALKTPNNILMQPAKLVRGLADALPANVLLAESSPVVEIEYGPTIRATTPGGMVEAEKVILAVNAFAPAFGFHRQRIFPVALHVSLTRPLTRAERTTMGAKPWGLLPAIHTSSPTVRLTDDHRIMIRAGFALSLDHIPSDRRREASMPHHRRLLRDRFPELSELTIEHSWTGFVCLSRNFAHGLAQPAPNIFTAVCENGVGATKSTVSGVCAADMAAGESNPLAADLKSFGEPERLPPSPFFEAGFYAKRRYETFRDRAET